MKNILIIEDDKMLNKGVAFALQKEGYNVISAYTKQEGKKEIDNNEIDFLLLDIGLPDGSGLDLCKEIKNNIDFPVVFFTANDTEEDMIKGFESGCDDYISKPFSVEVLKFKINAILKRSDINAKKLFIYRDLKIDFDAKRVYKRDKEIKLSATEYKLLEILCKNKGKAMTKEILLDKLWDYNGNFVDENTLSVNIRRLRKKIEDDSKNPTYIITLFGIGYIIGE
ncbi:response regulator transcription factor [Intestinibacter bartlettii]|uniref:Response regulator transcription factor n=1 Tax=Intestinibacter bartlettii TaxID=261299 RepID=A0ABS6DTC5_9FIRM|nr:response regulator transcription factor [Intestinibacter bartlettii]MBU5335091.1 response regulator transcription factor [Intestinibacter bartlettii]